MHTMLFMAVLLSLLAIGTGMAEPWEQPGTHPGQEIVGPDGAVMVWVPPGEFDMGIEDPEGYPDERPVHRVRITRGFWMHKTHVTVAQYRKFCEAVGRTIPAANDKAGDDHPVVGVSWDAATAYCQHFGLRLPTEAEWEWAAAGPEGRKYPWGDQWDESKCCGAGNKGPEGQTWPAGHFPDNASWCGALDMAGQAWQWCQDWYSDTYYAVSPSDDPSGPSEQDATYFPRLGKLRVLRGGAWNSATPLHFRCAHRSGGRQSSGASYDGFRPVRGL